MLHTCRMPQAAALMRSVSFLPEDDAHCKISFEADEKWLDAPDRCFPVVLDPVTTTSKKAKDIMDAHVDSKHEEDNFQTNIFLKTMGGDNIQRSFVKFVLPEISTGDMVLNARLVLVSLTTDGKERTVNVTASEGLGFFHDQLVQQTCL